MSRPGRGVMLGWLLLATVSCDEDLTIPPAVFLFMECIECSSGELASVAAMGDSAVPILRGFLLDGPPQASVDRLGRSLSALVGDTTHIPAALAPAVVRQVESYVAVYRLRSAVALGAIGTPRARTALCAGRASAVAVGTVGGAIDSALTLIGRGGCP